MKNSIINKLLNLFDLHIYRVSREVDIDFDEEGFQDIYNLCAPYTMTPKERMYSLYNSLNYIIDNNIPGDFVECGVWKGGSAMMIAKFLKIKKIENRKIYLYDTFEGMVKPGDSDINLWGEKAADKFSKTSTGEDSSDWAYAPIEEVKHNIGLTGFSEEHVIYVKGKVENTIPSTVPSSTIAILRLDTDWYESTMHELVHLFPKISKYGVLIIDDYGHWTGSKKATLEYFEKQNEAILLNKVDYAARIGVKMSNAV